MHLHVRRSKSVLGRLLISDHSMRAFDVEPSNRIKSDVCNVVESQLAMIPPSHQPEAVWVSLNRRIASSDLHMRVHDARVYTIRSSGPFERLHHIIKGDCIKFSSAIPPTASAALAPQVASVSCSTPALWATHERRITYIWYS